MRVPHSRRRTSSPRNYLTPRLNNICSSVYLYIIFFVTTTTLQNRRVLFVCTANSVRSQMAEGFLKTIGRDRFEVYSAGTDPKPVHPMAVAAMANCGIDISRQSSHHVGDYTGMRFDFIISLCDRTEEDCPLFPGDPVKITWDFEDPAASGDYVIFARVAREIRERVKLFALVQTKSSIE